MDPDEYCRVIGKRVIPYDNQIVIALGDEISLGMYQFEIDDVKSFEGREIIKEDKNMKKQSTYILLERRHTYQIDDSFDVKDYL